MRKSTPDLLEKDERSTMAKYNGDPQSPLVSRVCVTLLQWHQLLRKPLTFAHFLHQVLGVLFSYQHALFLKARQLITGLQGASLLTSPYWHQPPMISTTIRYYTMPLTEVTRKLQRELLEIVQFFIGLDIYGYPRIRPALTRRERLCYPRIRKHIRGNLKRGQ